MGFPISSAKLSLILIERSIGYERADKRSEVVN